MGAVETLIVWENLAVNRVVVKNSAGELNTLYLTEQQCLDSTYFKDPATGLDMETVEKDLFLEWLAENYKKFGATLEIVTNKSQEGAQFVRGFGGIGGLLRWKLDMAEMGDDDDDFM
jgi:peptide chain release factor subunit 1